MTVPSYPPVDREHGREHVVKEEAAQQEAAAERLARRLDRPIGALGLVFLLVIIGQSLAESPTLRTALTIVAWLMWTVFVAELGLRAWVAPDRRRFWRRNWWQVLFLAVPFLRFARALSLVRAVRITGVLTAAVRGSRSASRLLSDRVAWLAVTTGVVVLASSQLLFLAGSYTDYAEALHAATLATIVGTPLSADGGSHECSRWCFRCTQWRSLRPWPAHWGRFSSASNRKRWSLPLSTRVSSQLERAQGGRRGGVETKRRIAAEPRFMGRRPGYWCAHVVRLVVGALRVLRVGTAAYGTLVVVLRVSGKRTLAKLNAFDFVVTVALGSTLATILLNSTCRGPRVLSR